MFIYSECEACKYSSFCFDYPKLSDARCCPYPIRRKTLRFAVDSCEGAFLYAFCAAFADNKPFPSAIQPLHSYPGVFAARNIRTDDFHQRVSAFEVLVNGPRKLFSAAAETYPACEAITFLRGADVLSAHGVMSLALIPHFGVKCNCSAASEIKTRHRFGRFNSSTS